MVDWSSSSSSGASTAIQEIKEKNRSYRKKKWWKRNKQTKKKTQEMCLTSTTRQHVKNAFHHTAGFLFSVCMSLFASSSHRVAIAKLTFVCTASTGGSGFLEGFCRHFSVYISLQMTEDFRRLHRLDGVLIMVPIRKESWLGVTKMRFLRSEQNKCIEISTENDSWMFDMWSHNTC